MLIVVCVAGLAYALLPHGAEICTASGIVVDQNSSGLGDVPVTLHVMGQSPGYNGIQELYGQTNVTAGGPPFQGLVVFANVTLPIGAKYAYMDANMTLANGTAVYGRSTDFSMNASEAASEWIVMPVPTQPLPAPVPA